jgi:hypothetical protein
VDRDGRVVFWPTPTTTGCARVDGDDDISTRRRHRLAGYQRRRRRRDQRAPVTPHGPRHRSAPTATCTFVDRLNHFRVRRIDAATGVISTVAGRGTYGPSSAGMAGRRPQAHVLASPRGVALDADRQRVLRRRRTTASGASMVTGIITTVAGTGVAGDAGDDGPAGTLAQLRAPTGRRGRRRRATCWSPTSGATIASGASTPDRHHHDGGGHRRRRRSAVTAARRSTRRRSSGRPGLPSTPTADVFIADSGTTSRVRVIDAADRRRSAPSLAPAMARILGRRRRRRAARRTLWPAVAVAVRRRPAGVYVADSEQPPRPARSTHDRHHHDGRRHGRPRLPRRRRPAMTAAAPYDVRGVAIGLGGEVLIADTLNPRSAACPTTGVITTHRRRDPPG